VSLDFLKTREEIEAELTPEELRQRTAKPAPGAARLKRQTDKLKDKGAIEKSITAVEAEARRADREIRFFCFLRDHRKCRAFGILLKFDTDNLKKKSENHHIVLKSAGGSDDPENRITLSPKAHQMRHAETLDVEGNGNGTVTFTEYEFNTDGSRRFIRSWESTL